MSMGVELYVLDKNKNPIKCMDRYIWSEFFREESNRIVVEETVGDNQISTLFLGIDHSKHIDNKVLFKTFVVNKDNAIVDFELYGSWNDAKDGHHHMVDKYLKQGEENV